MCFSANGQHVAACGDGVLVYSVANQKIITEFGDLDSDRTSAIAFSPDGNTLVSANLRAPGLRLWNWRTGKELCRTRLLGNNQLVYAPSGRELAGAGEDGSVYLLDSLTLKPHWRIKSSSPVERLLFSKDGTTLIAGRADGSLAMFDANSGAIRRSWQAHRDHVSALALQRNGEQFASGGRDGAIRIWNTSSSREIHPVPGHQERVSDVICFPDGRFMLSASYDQTVILWDMASGKVLNRTRSESIPNQLAVAANGRLCGWIHHGRPCYSRFSDWHPTFAPLAEPTCCSLAIAPDAKFITCLYADGRVKRWDTVADKITNICSIVGKTERWAAWDTSADASTVAVTLEGGRTCGFSFSTKRLFDFPGLPAGYPAVLRFNNEGTRYISCVQWAPSSASLLQLCDAGRPRPDVPIDRRPSIPKVAFSRTGRLFAFVADGCLVVHETCSGLPVQRLPLADVQPDCIAFCPDSRRIVTGNRDSTLLVWDLFDITHDKLSERPIRQLWLQLSSSDPRVAYQALWQLTAAPSLASKFLGEVIQPVTVPDPRLVTRLLQDLDDASFDKRQAARKQLADYGPLVEPSLRQQLSISESLEVKASLRLLLKPLDMGIPSQPYLQQLRAIEFLEHLGSKEAKEVLARIATGDAVAPLTKEARESLHRLGLLCR